MAVDLHTVAVSSAASPPAITDRLVLLNAVNMPFQAAAAAISSIDQVSNAGTGYTQLPVMAFTGGTGTGGLAVVTALKGVSTTIVAGGSSYSASDTISLSNGVVLTVSTVAAGVITGIILSTAGSTATQTPANPLPQVTTNSSAGGAGLGQGATFNVLWGVSTVQIVNSGSYSVVPTGASFVSANGLGSNAAVQSIHLGGNGLPIFAGLTGLSLPTPLQVHATPSISGISSVPLKRSDCIAVRIDPITAAVAVAAGTVDILAIG